MRTLLVPQLPWKALLAVLSLCFALPSPAQAQTAAKTQTKAKAKAKKTKAKPKTKAKAQEKTPLQEAKSPEPEAAPAQEAAKPQATEKAAEAEKAAEVEKAPAPEKAPATPKAPAQQKAAAPQKPAPQKVARPEKEPVPERPMSVVQAEERARLSSRMRVGVGLDLFTEKSHLSGAQSINASRTDESFDYSSHTFLAATLSMSIPAPVFSDRARLGGAVRLFGNYSASGNRSFGFGLLNQAFVTGEYGLPVANRTEVVFGGRAGLSMLLPGRDFNQEIDRLQIQGVDVWSVPRLGWLAGLSVGGRRQMNEHIHLRADLSAQLDKTYLFATTQTIEELEFSKDWSTTALRLGFTLGAEFSL